MAILSPRDRDAVREQLGVLVHRVTFLFFTQTIQAPETALLTRQVLDEVASLSDLVEVEEVNFVLERERAAQFGISGVPAIVLLKNGADTRIRFLGAPTGYEFASLLQAVILAGTDFSGLMTETKAAVATSVTAPLDIKVFVTPTCPHCPRAVTLANQLAVESPFITATCVEAIEFPELSRQYRVTGVPKTVANDSIEILGAVPEDELVRALIPPAGQVS